MSSGGEHPEDETTHQGRRRERLVALALRRLHEQLERHGAQPNTIPEGLLSNLDTEVMAFGLCLKHRRPQTER